jgi:hypothetical protein
MNTLADDKSTLELVSEITEFNDISEQLQDQRLDEALALVVKLVAKPDIPVAKVPTLLVTLQALSAEMAIKANYYTNFEKGSSGTLPNKKKNVYYTMSSSLDRLVDALKYMMKF